MARARQSGGLWQSVRDLRERAPLRVKLITAVLALVAVALVIISVAGIVFLRTYLLNAADSELTSLAQQAEYGRLAVPGTGATVPRAVQEMAEGITSNGHVISPQNTYLNAGQYGPVIQTNRQWLAANSLQAITVPAQTGGGRWRILIIPGGATIENSLNSATVTGTLVVGVNVTSTYGTLGRLTEVDIVVSAILLVLLFVVGLAVVQASLQPLTEIEETAGAIAAGDLSRRVPERDPRTEVGRLGRSLNAMLAQIEAAFDARARSEAAARRSEERMRRFVADASHELRTPLTAIRGFAEYYRQRGVGEIEVGPSGAGAEVTDGTGAETPATSESGAEAGSTSRSGTETPATSEAAGTGQPGANAAAASETGTEAGGTSQPGTETPATSEAAGTGQPGANAAATSETGTEAGGTSQPGATAASSESGAEAPGVGESGTGPGAGQPAETDSGTALANGNGPLARGDLDRIMRRVEQEAARMGLLVEDMLLLARLDQQRPLEFSTVDLLTLAADSVQDARVIAPGRSISLTVGSGAALLVRGDEVRLRQVISNLMSNALNHTPDGTPIEVTLRSGTLREVHDRYAGAIRGALPGQRAGSRPVPSAAVLEVTDHGPGLDAEHAEHVFERFYRADKSRAASGGTGLGLAIVSALVAAHGGQVWLNSRPGQGATFGIALPLSPEAAQGEQEPEEEVVQ
jgi:signal transduction histidine kinase